MLCGSKFPIDICVLNISDAQSHHIIKWISNESSHIKQRALGFLTVDHFEQFTANLVLSIWFWQHDLGFLFDTVQICLKTFCHLHLHRCCSTMKYSSEQGIYLSGWHGLTWDYLCIFQGICSTSVKQYSVLKIHLGLRMWHWLLTWKNMGRCLLHI